MKLYLILDHPGYNKTMPDNIKKWQEAGHEVVCDMYYDRAKADWADIIFGEYIQGGVIHCLQDETLNKPIYIRGIDIDLYFGHYMGIDWDKCKAVMFINDYMRNWIVEKYTASVKKPSCPIYTTKLGVDLARWTYRERKGAELKKIGWLNNFWSGKGVELLCQIIYNVVKRDPEYHFDVVGSGSEPWLEKYFEKFIERNGLKDNVTRNDSVAVVNDWMEDKDFILSTSMKECMSLPMVEAMAKGIRPIIHNWWGADELFPKELVFNSVDEAMDMIFNQSYKSAEYRKFVEENHNNDTQLNLLNKIMDL